MKMNKEVAQLATIRISCNGEVGTAVMYYLDETLEYMYVFTAKHCLTGKKFNKDYVSSDIVLDKILNEKNGSWHSYNLTETDITVCSSNEEDLALLIIPKQRILNLTDNAFTYQIVATIDENQSCLIRGFASFNSNEDDRPFNLKFVETIKENKWKFILKAEENLDTFYDQALDNVKGLSGCGVFANLRNNLYLIGIIHDYEDKNLFLGTKILAYNKLIPTDKYVSITAVVPELNDAVINTFSKIDENREIVNRQTKDTVATISIQRDLKNLRALWDSARIAVIHGKPGVGKSAMAKSLVAEMMQETDTTIITFTPEQLYTANIAEALSKAGYTVGLEQIANSPLSGKKIVIWIESFEKLIESGHEGAFYELVTFINKHPRLSLLITIRDYLLQKFKITYHYELPSVNIYYQVNEFNDVEINKVREQIPVIIPLLDNSKISKLLRTPYYLDKATRILPQLLQEDHLDEIGFKRLMWEHIVEAGIKERGTTFLEIALKRAREMSMYTSFEASVTSIDALVKDNILQVEESELRNRYSPSHDILEDWALIRHIKQRKQEASSPQALITSLESSPAIRRAFRLWLDELYKQEIGYASDFSNAILLDTTVEQNWKDELIITILRSDNALVLFDTVHHRLLDNSGILLKHYIYLLETGCKILGDSNNDFSNLLSIGSGWDVTITFIRKHWEKIKEFKNFEYAYLSIIESWSKQLPDFNPVSLPPAANDSAFLLLDFLFRYQGVIGHYESSSSKDFFFKKYAAILFKLTSVVPAEIEEIVEAAVNVETEKNKKWFSKDFLHYIRDYIKDGVISDQICKYFPDKVLKIALEEWKEKPDEKEPDRFMIMTRKEEAVDDFGLAKHLKHDTEPPSGYRTFFYWMFLYHADEAVDFLIRFLNEAFEHNQKVLSELKQEVLNIQITFKSGATHTYFGCYEYWTMYRHSYSRNKIVSSLLMALEGSLLNLADADSTNYVKVREYLSTLIYGTNNVAVLAVVTSVIQAHPALLDENSISLLGIPSFFHWDGGRSTSEFVNLTDYSTNPFLRSERIIADKRPHRQKYYQGLVGFVADYMFYYQTHNDLLFKQIDSTWENAPAEDKIWRKFLFDMDVRKYRFVPVEIPGSQNYVRLVPGYDAIVEEAIGEPENIRIPTANRIWADNVFNGKKVENQSYQTWEEGYQYIRNPNGRNEISTAPGTMATIGIRDFFDQLTEDEAEWCKNTIVEQNKRLLIRKDIYAYDPYTLQEVHIIYGLPLLFKMTLNNELEEDLKRLVFELLTSNVDERSKIHLEASIVQHLWPIHPEFVLDCWYGLLEYARLSKLANQTSYRSYNFYDDDNEAKPSETVDAEELSYNWKQELVASVLDSTVNKPNLSAIILETITSRYLDDALRLIPYDTIIPIHRDFIQKLFQSHLNYFEQLKQRYDNSFFESRHAFKLFYARYLLAQPFDDAAKLFRELLNLTRNTEQNIHTSKAKEFLYDLIKENIAAVNYGSSLENFWHLWELLKEWIEETKIPYLFPLLLMDFGWNKNSDFWHVLEGKKYFYIDVIMSYGFNDINASFKLLTGVGFKNFMPESVTWAAWMLTSKNSSASQTDLLEDFVHKAFYNYGSAIKTDKQLLNDFLFILDFLINLRSTKAYMLKEELIQYK